MKQVGFKSRMKERKCDDVAWQNQCHPAALHTCRYLLKDKFARHTGYNEVGELNNIIIIFPQATAIIDNPLGCWDWWGYTVKFYRK